MVSEKKIFKAFLQYKSMETLNQQGGTGLDSRGLSGRILGDYKTLLHTKYISCGPLGFR